MNDDLLVKKLFIARNLMEGCELIEKIVDTYNNAVVEAKILADQEDWDSGIIKGNAMEFCIDEILANCYIENFLQNYLTNSNREL